MATFGNTLDAYALDPTTGLPLPGVELYAWADETGGAPLLSLLSGLDGSFGWEYDTTADGQWVSSGLTGPRVYVPNNDALASRATTVYVDERLATKANAATVGTISAKVDTTETRVGTVEDELTGRLSESGLSATYAADQVDFVDLVRANSPRWSSRRFVKTAANTYQVRLHDGTKGVTYQFVKDVADDFHKIDGCYTGYGSGVSDFFAPTTAALTGTWNTSTSSWYTTVVGATFTGTVKGDRVDIRVGRESRGGLWHVTVDGSAPVPVTCYNATTVTGVLVTVATGLDPTVEHTVVATFQGNDPANPPSSTPSRGYIRYDATGSLIGYEAGAATTTMILADASNKEFAFDAGAWIPQHDAVGTAFQITAPAFYVDGAPVDVAAMAVGDAVTIADAFELRQHFHGRVGGTNYLEFHTTHTVDGDGVLSFAGRFETLAAVSITAAYPLMLPGWDAVTDTFVNAALVEHGNTGTEAYTYFAEAGDALFSGAVVSSTNPDAIGAATLVNPRLSYRRPATTGKPAAGQSLFVWNRATKPKLYWQSMAALNLTPGDAYAWGARFIVGEVEGARSLVTP